MPLRRPLWRTLAATLLALAARGEAQERPELTASINGPRAAGRGATNTASRGDVFSIGGNPATLFDLEHREFAIVSRTFLSVADPTARGVDSVSTATFSGSPELQVAVDALEFVGFAEPFELFGRRAVAGVAWRRFSDGVRVGSFQVPISTAIRGAYAVTTEFASRGGLRALSPSLAVELPNRTNLGIAMHAVSGEASYSRWGPRTVSITMLNLTAGPVYSTVARERTALTIAWTIGGTWTPSERLRLGASALLPHQRATTVVEDSVRSSFLVRTPAELAFGASLSRANGAQLSMDLRHAAWSRSGIREDSAGTWIDRESPAHDGSSIHVGYERPLDRLRGRTALRLGGFARRSTQTDERNVQITAIGVSVGESWTLGATTFDYAVVYSAGSSWRRNRDPLYDVQVRSHDVSVAVGVRRR